MTPEMFIATYNPTSFFHFTDKRNLPSIAAYGLQPWSVVREHCQHPGGNDWSHQADEQRGLHTYVHLCLTADHPMEYRARERGDIGETVFLAIDTSVIAQRGVLFFPDVSNKKGVVGLPLEEAVKVMDFQAVYARLDWKDPSVRQRRQAARKYEVLLPSPIPPNLIRGL